MPCFMNYKPTTATLMLCTSFGAYIPSCLAVHQGDTTISFLQFPLHAVQVLPRQVYSILKHSHNSRISNYYNSRAWKGGRKTNENT